MQNVDITSTESAQSMSTKADTSANTVDLLFEKLSTDKFLPKRVTAVLADLKLSYLNIAAMEPDFLADTGHPASQLFNAMADAGMRWVGNDNTDQYDILAKLQSTVDRLTQAENLDHELVLELDVEFSNYTANLLRRQELMEKRALEKVQGEEKLLEAKIQVSNEVRMRTDQHDVPATILLLLLQPWSEYMSFVLLRYGQKSDSWLQALETIDDLLWTFEPKKTQSDKVKQLELQDELLVSLERGLKTIGYDQTKIDKQLENLGSLWRIALLSRDSDSDHHSMRAKIESRAAEKAGYPIGLLETLTDEETNLLDQLLLLEFGTWIELSNGKREKISWHNKKTQRLLIVDQVGRKTRLISGVQLARDILAGEVALLEGGQKPFTLRALPALQVEEQEL